MFGMMGVEFFSWLCQLQFDCGCIILLGYVDLNVFVVVINEVEIVCFIFKFWVDFDLFSVVCQVLCICELMIENQWLVDQVCQQMGVFSVQEVELCWLEWLEFGIIYVKWGSDGFFILEDLGEVGQ